MKSEAVIVGAQDAILTVKWSRNEPYPQTDVCKEEGKCDTREDDPHRINHDQARYQDTENNGDALHTRRNQVNLLNGPGAVEVGVLLEPGLHLTTNVRCALEEDVGQHGDVEMPVSEHTFEHAFADLRAVFRTLALHAGDGQLALIIRDPPHFRLGCRQTRKEEEAGESNGDANAAIDDEKPTPTRHASNAVESLVCSCLEVAAEHRTSVAGNIPYSCTLEHLIGLISRCQEVYGARCRRSLQHTEQEASAVNLVDASEPALGECQD